jgi:hypothetical protein
MQRTAVTKNGCVNTVQEILRVKAPPPSSAPSAEGDGRPPPPPSLPPNDGVDDDVDASACATEPLCRRDPRAYSFGSRILLASIVDTDFEASDNRAPLAILLTETRSRKGRREASM